MDTRNHARLNIYLDDLELRTQIRVAAARQGVSLSAYCLQAIRRRLVEEGVVSAVDAGSRGEATSPLTSARELDRLRRAVGRIGVPVSELIAEGRRR